MAQALTGAADRSPSYSSIAATSSQHLQPTAPEYHQTLAASDSPGRPFVHYEARSDATSYNSSPQQEAQQTPSYVGHVAFACVVFWCCNLLFGFVAFIFAS